MSIDIFALFYDIYLRIYANHTKISIKFIHASVEYIRVDGIYFKKSKVNNMYEQLMGEGEECMDIFNLKTLSTCISVTEDDKWVVSEILAEGIILQRV